MGGGEFGRVAVQSLRAPLGKAFLSAARVSFGEPGGHLLGLGRVSRRLQLPRRGIKRNWLSIP